MRRSAPLGGVGVAVLAVVLLTLVACGGATGRKVPGTLSVHVTPSKRTLAVAVADERAGEHTVWVVLANPPAGQDAELLACFDHGVRASGVSHVVCGVSDRLPAGVYRYVIYGADGVLYTGDSHYWTPQHRLGGGTVTVR
jgi:hypothetical protein